LTYFFRWITSLKARNDRIHTLTHLNSYDIFSLVENQFKILAALDPKLTLEIVADNKVSIQFSEIPFDELIN